MTCPGGCIAGGGQPYGLDAGAVKSRMEALYSIDKSEKVRTSHSNKSIQKLYNDYLGKPLGEKSHKLLHTSYLDRKNSKET
jgi:iron only hydrogenase large subunit-like protein